MFGEWPIVRGSRVPGDRFLALLFEAPGQIHRVEAADGKQQMQRNSPPSRSSLVRKYNVNNQENYERKIGFCLSRK